MDNCFPLKKKKFNTAQTQSCDYQYLFSMHSLCSCNILRVACYPDQFNAQSLTNVTRNLDKLLLCLFLYLIWIYIFRAFKYFAKYNRKIRTHTHTHTYRSRKPTKTPQTSQLQCKTLHLHQGSHCLQVPSFLKLEVVRRQVE